MLIYFKKKLLFFVLSVTTLLACMYISNEKYVYAESPTVLEPFVRTPENSPEYFGKPTKVDISKVNIEHGILTGIDKNERLRLWEEAENHNTPVILDLSDRNDINEVASNAINGTPIMVLKLPASVTKIGDSAFANNMIRDIDFGAEPDGIQISSNAFKQLMPDSNSLAEVKELESNGQRVFKPVACDVMFYRVNMENPFRISVNGTVKSYASIERQVVTAEPFISPVTSNDWSRVIVTPDFAVFNADSVYVSSRYPYIINARYKNVSLEVKMTLPLNRTFNYDITPSDPNNPAPTPKLALLGFSAGIPMNYIGEPLLSQNWSVVTIKDVYPNASEEYVKRVNDVFTENYTLKSFYSANREYNPFFRTQVAYTNKKIYDFEFFAKHKNFRYIYYDVNTGQILKDEKRDGYYGTLIPAPNYPEGYEGFIKPGYFAKGEVVNDALPFTYRIPVKKINSDTSNKVTVSIKLINEGGVRIGTTYYSIGDKGSDVTMPKDLEDFLKKYNYELKENFEEGQYDIDKTVTLIIKGNVVGKPGLQGPRGANGADGKDGIILDIRISGSNRIKTGIELSGQNFKTSNTVVLASSENFADALTGGVIAGLNKSPILISYRNITKDVIDEIERLEAKNIIIVGGEDSISNKTKRILQQIGNVKVIRLGGTDRFETSKKVAEYVYNKFGNNKKVLIASGIIFPDALTSSQYAIKEKSPILLTGRNKLTYSAKSFIEKNNVKYTIVVGGDNTITKKQYDEISINKKRIAGKDRFETAIEFSKLTYDNPSTLYIASATKYQDVLTAVPVAYKNKAPILLSDRFYVNDVDVKYYNSNNIKRVWLVGGPDSISNKVYFDLVDNKKRLFVK